MSDMSHTEAEEALATGDEQDVYEAVEAEREESEAPPDEAELEAIADDAVVEEVAEEIAEVVAEVAVQELVEEIVEEIVEEAVLETLDEIPDETSAAMAGGNGSAEAVAEGEPDLVVDVTAPDESAELGGWGEDEDAEEEIVPVESPYDRPGRWYVVHTYSGYENKVRSN